MNNKILFFNIRWILFQLELIYQIIYKIGESKSYDKLVASFILEFFSRT